MTTTPAQFNLRSATKEDCPDMMELIHELAVYEKAPEEVTVQFDHFVDCGFGSNPVWQAWVAENEDKKVIGFALCYIRYSTWKGTRLYLEDLIVTEAYRGKGIGQQFMDLLIEEGKKAGHSGMMWQVLDWNDPAINFYNKLGADLDEGWINCSLNF